MLVFLHPENPEKRILKQISENLKDGEVYIFPSDTVYSFVADSKSKSGIEKLYNLKNLEKSKPLSLLCPSISVASEYIENIPNSAFRLMKKITPGPFTFIFKANKKIPRVSLTNQKTKDIGIRIPDNIYLQSLLEVHGDTLIGTSVYSSDEYMISPDEIEDLYGKKVKGIINGGILKQELSTIIDFSSGDILIIREGKGIELIVNFT
ncbi:MAG: threonylcarbamoyl-AMP synthase [Spirochaetia bacterium]|nr:threonylcarbamoyl-AMP synthase [Spirochaetia bacterium]